MICSGASHCRRSPRLLVSTRVSRKRPPSWFHKRAMKILDTRVYRGPNLYALRQVIRLKVDLDELEDYPTVRLPGSTERLLELMPTLQEHTCSYAEPGGFVRRMTEDEGTWLGHVLEHVAIELQCLAGTPVSYGKTRSNDLP